MVSVFACGPVPAAPFSQHAAVKAAPRFRPDLVLVLPAEHRMRRSADFAHTMRGGVRRARPTLVIHVNYSHPDAESVVGFVVSKAVGGAVERNLVKRRLRAIMTERCETLGKGFTIVVRALPGSRNIGFSQLREQCDGAFEGAMKALAARAANTVSA